MGSRGYWGFRRLWGPGGGSMGMGGGVQGVLGF